MANTTLLGLPLMAAAQSQKHVTHNDAIIGLDVLVQMSVKNTTTTIPPASPVEGDRYLIATGATGAWVGKDLNITLYTSGAWRFFAPRTGWFVWDELGVRELVYRTNAWGTVPTVVTDSLFTLIDDIDPTKKAAFQLSGLTTGTTRTYTLPNVSDTLAVLGAQTFTGTQTIAGISVLLALNDNDAVLGGAASTRIQYQKSGSLGAIVGYNGAVDFNMVVYDGDLTLASDHDNNEANSVINFMIDGGVQAVVEPQANAVLNTSVITGLKGDARYPQIAAATVSLGTSTAASTVGLANGATLNATTKTLNLGIAGVSGSTTVVNIGSAVAGALGTLVINSPTVTFASTVTAIGAASANISALYLGLGGATADATNRFSINTPAMLLNNSGATIAVTLNKNLAANDASFIFQTAFSSRALFGLLATDDFTIKTSPDGSTFKNALVLDKTTAQAYGRAAGAIPSMQIAKQTVDSARSDVATAQAVFDAAFDTLTIEASTTYEFEAEYSITRAVGVTAHTVGILFGGTATFTSIGYMVSVANANGSALSNGQMLWVTVATLTTITPSNTSATESVMIGLRGTIRSNAAGTIIPQFQYSAAPGGAMTIKANSSFRAWPIGADTISSVGANWS